MASSCLVRGPSLPATANFFITNHVGAPSTQIRMGNRVRKFAPMISTTKRMIRCCAVSPELRSTIDKVVASSKVVLFMKGTKDFPQCGFSNTVVQVLKSLNTPFETINILENEMLRQGVKEYSNWPTFPQLYINGEFFGGCDITVAAYQNGELQELLQKSAPQ